jgi:hypothetical protein
MPLDPMMQPPECYTHILPPQTNSSHHFLSAEGAKIYAQNAIRKKHEQLNYLKLASRLDAVVSRLDTQAKMSMVNRNMMAITKNLEKALQANNLEKVGGAVAAGAAGAGPAVLCVALLVAWPGP